MNDSQPILIFLIGELLTFPVFWLVVKLFKKQLTLSSVLRGILERIFLFVCLLNDLPQGLAFFGALKIATRLKETDDKISNDYFLTGNIISVLIVIIYFLMNKHFQFL